MLTVDNSPRSTAILLIGHGTRDTAGISEFLELARMLTERMAPVAVFPCFLELAAPTIAEAVSAAVDAGARYLVAAPVLLFAAGHAKSDIPAALATAAAHMCDERGIELSVHQTDVLECHPRLLELSKLRFDEAVASPVAANQTELPAATTCLVMVGRGSFDADAIAAMHRFTALREEASPVHHAEAAFVAMASPKYGDALRRVATQGFARVVVQPHLLFSGELLKELQYCVAALTKEFPDTQWLLTSHLGPHALLTDAVESKCQAAMVRN
jgi:sirohydrochlorin ferrochelatase